MSSDERGKKKVEIVEEVEISVDLFYHPHPFTLGVIGERSGRCYGCRKYIYPAETAYACREGCRYPRLHEECAEMPREIRMSMHPQHTLIQKQVHQSICAVCEKDVFGIGYHCTSLDGFEDKDVIVFPTNNAEEMIRSFVSKVGGAMPNHNEMDNRKYKFHSHDHLLHLISSSLNDQEKEEEEEDYNNYDDGLKHGELVCDGCTIPIFPNKHKSSSSSSSSSSSVSEKYYYMSCGKCKYFLHLPCFHLPPELPSHHLHLFSNHNLSLQTCPKLEFAECRICGFYTNGLFYKCTECDFQADIKCASLPNTIKHESHPRHLLKLHKTPMTLDNWLRGLRCTACGRGTVGDVCYTCEICKITLHSSCALLPAVVRNPEWEKHPLPLTFDASVDHPTDFYCDICEQQMNPKMWMYHCRTCDFSLHPRCYPAASGDYRNIKFGQRYDVASVHHHPLRYQILTTKLNCGVCGIRQDYGTRGFQCTSHNCDFFMCLNPCGGDRKALMQAVD